MKKLFIHPYFFYFLLISAWVGLWAYGTVCGLGQTFDSVQYRACAHSIAQGKGFRMADGSPFTAYPPLYPILLMFGGASMLWTKFLHLFCGIFSLVLWLNLARKYFQTALFLRLFGFIWILSTPILLIHSFVWSEAVFLLLLSMQLWLWSSYLNNPPKSTHLGCLVILSGLLCLQRNAGLVFVFWMSVGFCLNRVNFERFGKGVLYFFLAILPTFVWKLISETPQPTEWIFTGNRDILKELIHNFQVISLVFINWFLPTEAMPFWIIGGFLGVFLVILVLVFVWKPIVSFPKFFFFVGIVWIGYGASLHLIPSEAIYFSDVERFLAVVYPMFFFLGLLIVEKMYLSFRCSARYFVLLLCLIWFSYPLMRTLKNAQFWHETTCKKATLVSKADVR